MAHNDLQTKYEEVDIIMNNLLDNYINKKTAVLINPKAFEICSAERRIERLLKPENGIDAAMYYAAKGIVYAAKGQYTRAKDSYRKAIKLNPGSDLFFSNYNNILIGASEFEEAKENLDNYFSQGGKDYSLLKNLFNSSMHDLDFSAFKKHYDSIKNESSLSFVKGLSNHYENIENLELLSKELDYINIDKNLFSEFYKLLSSFYSSYIYDSMSCVFEIDVEDEYLFLTVYTKLLDKDILSITSRFEEYIVDSAISRNNSQLLSKFAVFYRNDGDFYESNTSPMYSSLEV